MPTIPPVADIRRSVAIPLQKHDGVESVFHTFSGLSEDKEHVAIELGDNSVAAHIPLVRLHSECLTGDVFASERCDCGAQLEESIAKVEEEGGYILYLRQEGRGIGLYNKLDAYALQLEGYDTYEANQMLGFDEDMRNFEVAAQMLFALGAGRVKLLSNNPDKREQLEQYGIDVVETVSTGAYISAGNHSYLKAKVQKANHRIDI